MNNILLEWVGQLLNHSQPNPSSLSSSPSIFLTHFQLISLATSPAIFKCFVFSLSLVARVNDMLLISIPLPVSSTLSSPSSYSVRLPFILPHPSPQSPISFFSSVSLYPTNFFSRSFSTAVTFFLLFLPSVLSCRSRSSLLPCVRTSTHTWRHLCRATKKPSSNAWRSSVWTSRWVRRICNKPPQFKSINLDHLRNFFVQWKNYF